MLRAIVRKTIFFILFYVVYFNVFLWLFAPQLYVLPLYMTYLLLFYTVALIDTAVRPLSEDRGIDKYGMIVLGLFSLQPILFVLAFYENAFIVAPLVPAWDNMLISYCGLVLYALGSGISVTSRMQLGRMGTAELATQDGHRLVKAGLYHHIRHPMYLGGFLGTLAFGLIFRSIIVLAVSLALYFAVFRQRWSIEEQLLEKRFEEEYLQYKKRTKRIIPFVY